ncbi:MAG: hypothetical protein ACK59M_17870 [Pseudomonadota bacterium]|jgi:hypothetical protein
MNALLSLARDLLLLRRGPQDLPYSPALLGGLCVVALLVDHALAVTLVEGGAPIGRLLFSLAMLVGLPAMALQMANLAARWVQTATALVATGIVFSLVALPVVSGVGRLPEDPTQLSSSQMVFGWLAVVLLVWQLAVKGSIFRHALGVPLRAGVLLAVAFFAIELVLGVALFGGSSG